MAVLIEASCVVIRKSAIVEHYRGGWDAFVAALPHSQFCYDDHLTCTYFMATEDARAYIEVVIDRGVAKHDTALVLQTEGVDSDSPWLKFIRGEGDGMKLSLCWLSDTRPDTVSAPGAWTYEGSLSQKPTYLPGSVVGERLKFLRHQDGVDVYLDLQTNKEKYVGRPVIEGDTAGAVFTQIRAILSEVWEIEAKGPVPKPKFIGRRDPRYTRLKRDLLPKVQSFIDGTGKDVVVSYFTLAKILLLLSQPTEAEQALRTTNKVAPGNITVLRELTCLLGQQGRNQEALPFAREAVELEPSDTVALGNLASALLGVGQRDEALVTIEQALEFEPNDKAMSNFRDHIVKQKAP